LRRAVRASRDGSARSHFSLPQSVRGSTGRKPHMHATAILRHLEESAATGAEADALARMGFMQWMFEHPGCITHIELKSALSEPALQTPASPAALAFVGFLKDAEITPTPVTRRRLRTERVLQ
ncbi:MAG: hypothetical protein AAFO17_16750, partial [Pseudomonadota bacterium]